MTRACRQFRALLLALAVTSTASTSAMAQQAGASAPAASGGDVTQPAAPKPFAKPYAIEFRARNAHSYGHTFSIHGRVNAQGKFVSPKVSGLHPATESAVPWMIGHLVAVPSETGASDGDTEDQFVIARFRVALSESEYRKVQAYIKELSGKSGLWHAVIYNCNTFIGDIARFMGLETPKSTMAMPQEYIDGLRDLNINRTNLAGVIGTPVKVADAAALRATTLKALEARTKQAAAAPKPAAAAPKPAPTSALAYPATTAPR
jgi:hypothetical protein